MRGIDTESSPSGGGFTKNCSKCGAVRDILGDSIGRNREWYFYVLQRKGLNHGSECDGIQVAEHDNVRTERTELWQFSSRAELKIGVFWRYWCHDYTGVRARTASAATEWKRRGRSLS